MSNSLFDKSGVRKYLVAGETRRFVAEAICEGGPVCTFCLALAFTGARISEVLAVTWARVDQANGAIVFETLKQRRRGIYRAVPVPQMLVELIQASHSLSRERLWPWCRTSAWKVVRRVMRRASIEENVCMPKALRHGFAVEAGQQGVPLNIVQRWLGHARIETTAIYSSALGEEEHNLARRVWGSMEIRASTQISKREFGGGQS